MSPGLSQRVEEIAETPGEICSHLAFLLCARRDSNPKPSGLCAVVPLTSVDVEAPLVAVSNVAAAAA